MNWGYSACHQTLLASFDGSKVGCDPLCFEVVESVFIDIQVRSLAGASGVILGLIAKGRLILSMCTNLGFQNTWKTTRRLRLENQKKNHSGRKTHRDVFCGREGATCIQRQKRSHFDVRTRWFLRLVTGIFWVVISTLQS